MKVLFTISLAITGLDFKGKAKTDDPEAIKLDNFSFELKGEGDCTPEEVMATMKAMTELGNPLNPGLIETLKNIPPKVDESPYLLRPGDEHYTRYMVKASGYIYPIDRWSRNGQSFYTKPASLEGYRIHLWTTSDSLSFDPSEVEEVKS